MRALTEHPAFSMTNPNRVRSLIGSFAQGNPTQFNRADGAGYEFVADTDAGARSEQSAGRLADDHRVQELARAGERPPRAAREAALQRIAGAPKLSRDVGDIVQRALAES